MKSVFFRTCGFVALAGAGMGACSSAVDSDEAVESITVTPSVATVAVGAIVTLGATLRDSEGDAMPGVRVLWTSEDATIASVSQTGVVTGVRVGSVLIAASARGQNAFARLTVVPTPVASVRLSATNHAMFIGDAVRLSAETLDGAGNVLSRPVAWATSNALVASVTGDGLVSAISPGGAIITATSEGRSAVVSITVSPVAVASIDVSPDDNNVVVGQSTQLTAELRDGTGTLLVDRLIAWSSSNASVATVTSQGVVTAVAPGSATITASVDGLSASANVVVTARPASAVILSPEQVTIFSGQALQLSALVTDDRGQLLPGRSISFASSNPQIATVSSVGLVTGIAGGTVTITATSGSASGSATVTVTPEPVAVLTVSPSTATVFVGQTIQLSALARNAAGQPLAGRVTTWSTSATTVATVSSSGLVTGVAAGSAVITATSEGKSATATITVQPAIASVTVTPPSTNLNVAWTATLTATARSATGVAIPGVQFTWSSSNTSIATVSSAGIVTGVAPGNVTISASAGGKTGTAAITVQLASVDRIVVTPANPSVKINNTVQLTATLYDAQNNVLTGRTVTWTSSNTNRATVSSTGLVTGKATGTTTVTASSGGKSGSTSVTITN